MVEALCIADNRFWSYCCVTPDCCPHDGSAMGLPGTSVLAAAATYAGLQSARHTERVAGRFHPWETAAALEQETRPRHRERRAWSHGSSTTRPARTWPRRPCDRHDGEEPVRRRPAVTGTLLADLRDDELLAHDEAATLISACRTV